MSPILRRSLLAAACGALLAALATAAAADPYADIQTALDAGKLREASDKADALTKANPSDCKAWLLLGDAERRLTRMDLAIAAYRSGIAACASDPALLKALGMTYDETEQYDEAVGVLSKLWALDSTDPQVASRLGAASYRAGRCAEGRKAYEALLTAHPERTADRMAYAQLLARSCKDATAAEAEYRKILAQRPDDVAVHCALAYVLAEAGRVDDAVKAAQDGIAAVKANSGCLYAAWGRALEAGADSLMTKGQVTPARDLYAKAVDPLTKGQADPVFGAYCASILSEVKYKESPMEDLKP